MAETIVEDNTEYRIIRRTSDAGFTDTVEWKPGSAPANEQSIRDAARSALATLQAIIDSPPATFGNIAGAQVSTRQLQAQVKDLARIQRRIIRLVLNDFSGPD